MFVCSEAATVFERLFQVLIFISHLILTIPPWSGNPSLCPSYRWEKYSVEPQMDKYCLAAVWSGSESCHLLSYISWWLCISCSPSVTKCYNFVSFYCSFFSISRLSPLMPKWPSQASIWGLKSMCDEISAPSS